MATAAAAAAAAATATAALSLFAPEVPSRQRVGHLKHIANKLFGLYDRYDIRSSLRFQEYVHFDQPVSHRVYF